MKTKPSVLLTALAGLLFYAPLVRAEVIPAIPGPANYGYGVDVCQYGARPAPTVYLNGVFQGQSAQGLVTESGGSLNAVAITYPGQGYPPSTTITCSATGGGGTVGNVAVTIDAGGNVVSGTASGGSGYTGSATLIVPCYEPPEFSATVSNGVITAITTTFAGSGILSSSGSLSGTYALTIVGGGGVNGAATATVSGGVVTSISVTNGGSGYNNPSPSTNYTAIQYALNNNNYVKFTEPGTYQVNQTLTIPSDRRIEGPKNCVIQLTNDNGNYLIGNANQTSTTGNANITIDGCTWDGQFLTSMSGNGNFIMNFEYCQFLKVENTTLQYAKNAAIEVDASTDVTLQNIDVPYTYSDTIHIHGPAHNYIIDHISIFMDLVNGGQGIVFVGNDYAGSNPTYGDMSEITIKNIAQYGGASCLNLIAGSISSGATNLTFNNVLVDNITGTTSYSAGGNAIVYGSDNATANTNYGDFKDCTIRHVHFCPAIGAQGVILLIANSPGLMENITTDDIVDTSTSSSQNSNLIYMSGIINRANLLNLGATSVTSGSLVDIASGSTVTKLNIDDSVMSNGIYDCLNNAGTITSCNISNLAGASTSQYNDIVYNGGTITSLNLNNISVVQPNSIIENNSTNTINANLANVYYTYGSVSEFRNDTTGALNVTGDSTSFAPTTAHAINNASTGTVNINLTNLQTLVQTVSASATVDLAAGQTIQFTGSASQTITLPLAAADAYYKNTPVVVSNTTANSVTLAGNGVNVDGSSSVTVAANSSVHIAYNGSAWIAD